MTLTHSTGRAPEVFTDRATRANQEARQKALLHTMDDNSTDRDAAAFLARLNGGSNAAYQAWLNGDSHPDDEFFSRIWSGAVNGVSEADARDRVATDTATIAAIESGQSDHTSIRGWRALGPDQQTVLANLRKRVEHYEEALRCGGRNLSINQLRVSKLRAGQS